MSDVESVLLAWNVEVFPSENSFKESTPNNGNISAFYEYEFLNLKFSLDDARVLTKYLLERIRHNAWGSMVMVPLINPGPADLESMCRAIRMCYELSTNICILTDLSYEDIQIFKKLPNPTELNFMKGLRIIDSILKIKSGGAFDVLDGHRCIRSLQKIMES